MVERGIRRRDEHDSKGRVKRSGAMENEEDYEEEGEMKE
jgi:hypothetical protein